MMARLWKAPETRALLLEIAPSAALFLIIWAKLSYFNFPPLETLENDWNPWYVTQAIQAVLATLATLLIILSPVVLLSASRRFAVLCGVNLVATLLVVADLVHFRFFGDIISLSGIAVGWQVGLIYKSVLELLEPRDILLVADLMIAACVWPRYRRSLKALPSSATHIPRVAVRWMILGGLLLTVAVPVRIVVLDRGDTFRYNFFRFFGARKIGLLNYHVYDGGKRLSRALLGRSQVTPEERARATEFVETWRGTAFARSPLFGVAQGRNVIFLMVESLHAFPLGMRIAGEEVMPNLNALASRSLHFTQFYDQTWEGTTSDGEFTSLQSLHPLPSGSVATTYTTNEFRGIPEVLADRGYATLSAHAYYGALWNMLQMHPKLGFQRSLFREAFQLTEEFNMGLADAEFFRQATPHLEQLPQPFMAYLMTLSTHHPYEMPEKYKVLDLGDLQGTLLGDYLQTVRYFDTALGQLLERLEASGLLGRSVLVVYGDHKADLGNPADLARLLAKTSGFATSSDGSDQKLWLEQRRLPLLIHLPGDAARGQYDVTGGHLDIAPTVLNLLGVGGAAMPALGRDLTQGSHSLVVFRNGGFVQGDALCIAVTDADAGARCYQRSTGHERPPAHFADRLREAKVRLEVSDILLRGDLLRLPPGPQRSMAKGSPGGN